MNRWERIIEKIIDWWSYAILKSGLLSRRNRFGENVTHWLRLVFVIILLVIVILILWAGAYVEELPIDPIATMEIDPGLKTFIPTTGLTAMLNPNPDGVVATVQAAYLTSLEYTNRLINSGESIYSMEQSMQEREKGSPELKNRFSVLKSI